MDFIRTINYIGKIFSFDISGFKYIHNTSRIIGNIYLVCFNMDMGYITGWL